jgi:serine/threonine protein kinase
MDSPHHIILVFEVMEGGDLLNYMYRNGHVAPQEAALSEDEAKYVFHQVAYDLFLFVWSMSLG